MATLYVLAWIADGKPQVNVLECGAEDAWQEFNLMNENLTDAEAQAELFTFVDGSLTRID